ncbi:T9SS type B sorting domain-containing protein [Winogradskyella litorisediminis]|uniref:T9SS type B sorting domain-containing protein n=1 Tax=Winogradskyella litorisediminis TaxID=1156618 RepID=A0ABW3NCD7_9FLAO
MFKKILSIIILAISFQGISQELIIQDGTFNQCTGVFTDSGGSTANYGSNENFTITICPDSAGQAIRLNFTAFNTQNGPDVLSFFDGTDTSAPSLGTFSGTLAGSGIGIIEPSSTNTSGCITVQWVSNSNGNTTGWTADISCFEPCQFITANLDSTSPTTTAANVVVADENETITFNGSGTFSNDGSGATYLWDFGDGNTATGETVTHEYTTIGIFSVTLVITDSAGCTSFNDIGLTAQIGSTSPGNPSVDAGADVDIPCEETCTTLTADFLDIGETNTYTVNSIPYVPPFPFSGLTNSVNTNIDDRWDDVEDLPFDLCFFGGVETQFQVGSNGVIRFDVDPTDTSNDFNPSNLTIPNNTDPALAEVNVFTPLHDIDPSVGSGADEIAWEIIGTAPNRVLAVSFFNVPMWNCNSEIATHMAVFYETTNVIDIYIENAPFCSSWNNNKVVGIQNDAGTEGFAPPGRNTNENGGWTASQEAWRFTPAGPSIVVFEWLDSAGNVLSTDASFEVCPTDPSTTYTARVTYTNCNGDVTVVTDDVTVTTNRPFDLDLGPNLDLCEGDPDVTLDGDVGIATVEYQWSLDGTEIMGETNPTLTVSSPNSGTYLLTATDTTDGCVSTDEVVITFSPIPIVNPVDDQNICDDNNDGFWDFDFSTLNATVVGVQTGVSVTYHNTLADAQNGDNALTFPYTNMAAFNTETIYIRVENDANMACDATGEFDITVINSDVDASFTLTPTCDGATATITGDTGGAFAFNPVPTDAAVIDTNTGTVTNGMSGTTYTVQYTVSGLCTQTATQDFTVLTADDSSFTMTPTCDGGTATVTGDAGGTFSLNPVPTDGAIIDAGTGEVTGGTFGVTYTVQYATSGACPTTSTQDVTVLNQDDASFTMTATCDGGTANITGDIGGTFVLNPVPTDGAVIDSATGEVTNGTSGSTYTIEYTTAGTCPDTSSQDVTVLTADDSSFTMTATCDGGIATIIGDTGGTFSFDPIPTDGAVIDSSTGEVTNGTSATTYTVQYTTAGSCPDTSSQNVTVLTADDSSFTVTPTCDGGTATITGDTGGTFSFNPAPTDGTVIDATTGEVTGGTSGTTYVVEYTTNGTCPQTQAQNLTVITADDSSFTMTPTCDGGTATITGDTGGTFSLNPMPTDGAVIDATSGEVTGGTFGTTYTVQYTTSGTCPTTSMQDVTVLTLDDASFTITPTCDGGTVTITGDTGGTFSLNPTPTDGAVINSATGEVTGGTSATTYTIEYTTAGACPDTSSQDVTVLTADDPSFTMTPTCDGGTATISGDAGGTFAFNPAPGDGAVIDSVTGEVTNATPDTSYIIEYTTSGTCSQTEQQTLNVLPEDDASFTVMPTCDGGVVTITGLMGGTFSFDVLPTDGAVIDATTGEVTNGTPGETYSIEYSVADVCPNSSVVTFNANQLPDDNVVIEDFLECENNTDFVFEFDLESKNDEILNGQDPALFTVTYHDSQQDADDLVDALASPYENTMNPQIIYVAITNNDTGCSVSTLSFNIEVLDGAEAFDDIYEECDEVGDNDGSTQFDLNSRIPNLIDTQDEMGVTVSFHFTEDDAIANENPLPFLYENLTNPQIVYVRVSNNIRPDECFEVSELTLQTNLKPIFDLDDQYTLCLTSNDEAVVPIPPVIDTGLPAGDYAFEWSFNGDVLPTQIGPSIVPTQGGTYSVVVTDTSTSTVTMCTETDTTEVIESGIPDTFDVEITSQSFTGNNMIIATATGNSTYEFSLDLGPWELLGEFDNVSGGDHTIYVRDVNGCGILSRDVTVIDYAKFFTPNGDGNNDTWTIKGIDTQPTAVIYIHDRYGKLLKQLSPTSPGWDGTYNGNLMPSSDYWFTLQYIEPTTGENKTFSAHFALKR